MKRRIAATLIADHGADAPLFEIGAGLGDLTEALLEHGHPTIALERDRDLIPLLEERFKETERFTLIEGNALTFELPDSALSEPWLIVGNLPYHISSRILFHLLDQRQRWSRLVLMFQRELAQRVASSAPTQPHWSALSAQVSRLCTVRTLCEVPPSCFTPAPNVTSSVVILEPKEVADDLSDEAFRWTVRSAFAARRKTLRNNMKRALKGEDLSAEDALSAAELDGGRRGETLTVAELVRLTETLIDLGLKIGA